MYKLLFDSDALIKITKAELLHAVAKEFKVFITEEVYEEAVTEGKKRLYEDAEKIENSVKTGETKIIKNKDYIKKKKPSQNFGKGEASAFQAYSKNKIIISDDLNFVLYLQKEKIRNLSSAHLIPLLVKKGKLGKIEAHDCLGRLKPYIRKEIYNLVKKDIEGE